MSKVYFSDRKAESHYNMLDKLEHVLQEMGFLDAIEEGEKVMVKTHFGQWGNTNYIRPAYVRKAVELIREAGGVPFVCESCGLGYGEGGAYGGRTTAPEYLAMAELNGYTQATVNAPILMADGYWGTDVFDVEIDGEYVKKVDVATAVLDSDKILMLTHAKGHGLGGLGGSVKNLGIGLVGKKGKAEMHWMGDIDLDEEKCLGPECSKCLKVCPVRCITMEEKANIEKDECIACYHCIHVCNRVKAKAISMTWRPNHTQVYRFVENALGVIDSIGREKFWYVNLAVDISDKCDCWNVGAPLLVHDIGIFGSKDPLAIDQASLDAINEAPANPESAVGKEVCQEKFATAHACKDPDSGEIVPLADIQMAHADKMKLGSREYELVQLTREKPDKS
ncbi:DUF362 domain-containing protein [Candidatus Thorarchaeota archaeon]|nr:MAG: DUF362 domain-containing protein [Candidatus Thorarchaeota archaeon]